MEKNENNKKKKKNKTTGDRKNGIERQRRAQVCQSGAGVPTQRWTSGHGNVGGGRQGGIAVCGAN